MRMTAASFRENTGLEHHETVKLFFFLVKSVSAMAYLFVLGFLAAGQPVDIVVVLVTGLAAVLDLVPEAVTLRLRSSLTGQAKAAEDAQLVMKLGAYVLLGSVMTGMAADAFLAYTGFTVLWLASFVVEMSVMVLAGGDSGY